MREVKYYIAWDDSEFESKEECLAYEKNALDCLKETCEKYSFFDKNMNLYCAPLESFDVEDWMDWLDNAVNNCEFIHRETDLTILAERFISDYWGFCILNDDFNHKTGWFKYDFHRNEWVKVDEQSTLIFC